MYLKKIIACQKRFFMFLKLVYRLIQHYINCEFFYYNL